MHPRRELHFLRPEAREPNPFSAVPHISHLHPQKITIDVCKVFGPNSVFFQQAAYLTGGSYIYLEHREAPLQYLIVRSLSYARFVQLTAVFQMSFLPTPSIRKIVTVPVEDKTDF